MNRNTNPGNWWDFSWNPITGCLGDCPYCYARRFAKRQGDDFTPKFHPERLGEPAKAKKPSVIFTCSMGDFWGDGVCPAWQAAIHMVWLDCPQHIFVVLTKNRYVDSMIAPQYIWAGVSIDSIERATLLDTLRDWDVGARILCLEPMLEDMSGLDFGGKCDWLIIGGLSGPRPYKPPREQIDCLIAQARSYGIPVWVKDNAGYPLVVRERP
jgi:protein gp37